jgi:hypothetical protein
MNAEIINAREINEIGMNAEGRKVAISSKELA